MLLLCFANFSCVQEAEYLEKVEQRIMLSPDIYYENLYTANTQSFESLYEEITIEDTYLSISKKINEAAEKNSIINGCDMNKAGICIFPLSTRSEKIIYLKNAMSL